jgi:HEPN domain-containing protein
MSTKNRAVDWLNQAKSDLEYAKDGLKSERYSHVCFMAQQAGEKAIKAIGFYHEYHIRGHSVAAIAKQIGINGEIEEAGKILDLYYISARYPDALPAGAPFEMFSKTQADQALLFASKIIQRAEAELHGV